MRIVLTTLNSKYIHPNLALRYLYCVGTMNMPGLYLKEFTINTPYEQVFSELVSGDYDIYCFSCYIWNIEKTKYLCENLKKANPDAHFILGGPEVSYDSEAFLEENPWADMVIRGEGEAVFYDITLALSGGNLNFKDIKGITYRAGDEIISNEDMPLLDFDKVPFPYEVIPAEDDKISYYESSRGCPFSCAYCMSSIEMKTRTRSLDKVKEELKYFINKKVSQVKFIDRTFNFDEKRTLEIMEYLIDNDNGVTGYHFEICAELVTDAFIEMAARARKGLFQFEIGVQSTNTKTLRAVSRNDNPRKVLENISKLTAYTFCEVHTDLIAGLPFEDISSFRISFNNVYYAMADSLDIGFLKLLKGTGMRMMAEEYFYEYERKAPYEFISNRFISAREVAALKGIKTVLELFHNRGGFNDAIHLAMERLELKPFDFYLELAIFFYGREYHTRNHAKKELYVILGEFFIEEEKVKKQDLGDALSCLDEMMKERLGLSLKERLKTSEEKRNKGFGKRH